MMGLPTVVRAVSGPVRMAAGRGREKIGRINADEGLRTNDFVGWVLIISTLVRMAPGRATGCFDLRVLIH